MKTLKITSKAKAIKIQVESLGTLNSIKYSYGRYKPGSFPVGRELEVNDNVHAIWSESRRDSDGAYCLLYCMVSK